MSEFKRERPDSSSQPKKPPATDRSGTSTRLAEVPDTLLAAVLYAPTIDPPNGALRAFLESGLLATPDAVLGQMASRGPSAGRNPS